MKTFLMWGIFAGIFSAGCGSLEPGDFAGSSASFEPDKYFTGVTRSWGVLENRAGEPKHRFSTESLRLFFAALGATAVQRGPLWWSYQHRHHHRHSDEEEDVHSPTILGFWASQIGRITSARNLPPGAKGRIIAAELFHFDSQHGHRNRRQRLVNHS